MHKPLVYIAGPYSFPDPVENTKKAIDIWNLIIESQIAIPIVPHLSMFIHLMHPKPVEFWYDYDKEIIRICDVLLRIPGASVGALGEVCYAQDYGIPVFMGEAEEFIEAVRTGPLQYLRSVDFHSRPLRRRIPSSVEG